MVRFRRRKDTSAAPRRRQPTGVSSSRRPVFSYHSGRSAATEPEAGYTPPASAGGSSKHSRGWRRRSWVRNLPSLIALGAVLASVLYCLGLAPNPKIISDDLALRTKEEYQQGAQQILKESLLNRTKLTINTKHFERVFRERFPEVADVGLTLPLISRRPVITVSTARPELILATQDQAYVLDKRGVAIMQAQDLPNETRQKLPVIQDQSNTPVELGKGILSTEDVEFITTVLEQLTAKGLSVQAITLPPRAHQVDIRINGQPYYVKFSVDSDGREAAGAFLAIKAKLERENSTPSEYIDVRVDGRAYYK